MCFQCWEKFGSPKIATRETKIAASLIAAVYDFHRAGGYLHIAIDDWNLDDGSIDFCKSLIEKNQYEHSKEQLTTEKRCVDLLGKMNIPQRASALARNNRFF